MNGLKTHVKEPRYVVSEFGLKGSLILYPDPEEIPVMFENISDSGVCVRTLADIKPAKKNELHALMNAAKRGNLIPIQLIFNNVKIPVNVLNNFDGNKYGMCISGHQKLSTLADKGKEFFKAVSDAAVKKGSAVANFVDYSTAAPEPQTAKPKLTEVPLPEKFLDLPAKHPLSGMISLKFDQFSKKVIFLRSLGTLVAGYYVESHLPDGCEMRNRLEEDDAFKKETIQRWVQVEFTELIGGKDKAPAKAIEDNFRQAVYSYMVRRMSNNITFDEISAIFDGKLPEPLKDIRATFMDSVCDMVEDGVEKFFDQYLSDANHDRSSAEKEKGEEQEILRMAPVELMKRFLWPKVLELGELVLGQKEAARTWNPKKKGAGISKMGGVVLLSQSGYDDVMANARGSMVVEEDPATYFDEIDLWQIYERTVEDDGKRRKAPFGMYVDTLHPFSKRKTIMQKVIKSPQWSRYYILKKSREQFGKAFGVKAPVMYELVEEHMLTDAEEKEQYV